MASPAFRESLSLCEEFSGLEENTDRYDLLLLVKRTGKLAGFTPRMIQLLDYYMAYTREIDWEEGSRPIVYQSLARTALDLGISERQVQKLEQGLFQAGAITWCDSGNHKRYGRRDPESGRILYAYGVDLTPLAYLRTDLEEKLHGKQLYDKAWLATKREISTLRRQIRSTILEMQEEGVPTRVIRDFEGNYEEIAFRLRPHIDLQSLRLLLDRHKRLYSSLLEFVEVSKPKQKQETEAANLDECTKKCSPRGALQCVHYKYIKPIQKNSCSPQDMGFQESVAETTEPKDLSSATGLQHVNLKQVLLASSERFRSYLPLQPRPMNWNDVIEAAYSLRAELGISQRSWAEACQTLSREGAALCVLLTDQATERPNNPVRQPAAYFHGMVNRARAGELRLHNSIYGLLELAQDPLSRQRINDQNTEGPKALTG